MPRDCPDPRRMKKPSHRLALRAEVVRKLDPSQLELVEGGLGNVSARNGNAGSCANAAGIPCNGPNTR